MRKALNKFFSLFKKKIDLLNKKIDLSNKKIDLSNKESELNILIRREEMAKKIIELDKLQENNSKHPEILEIRKVLS